MYLRVIVSGTWFDKSDQASLSSEWNFARTLGRFWKAMSMITVARRAIALAALLLIPMGAPALAQTAQGTARPLPTPVLSKVPLHTEFVVEVNELGQIVRVKSGKSCKDPTFNAQTYGNVLQMWIRRPDGSAIVGLYRVTYDFDPGTKKVRRGVALLKTGGDWAEKRGAANDMMDTAERLSKKYQNQNQQKLPSLQQITGSPTPKPTPHA